MKAIFRVNVRLIVKEYYIEEEEKNLVNGINLLGKLFECKKIRWKILIHF